MTQTPGLLTFHTQTGQQNGGSGHILFRGTRIHLTMISENTVAKTKTHRYGFLHKPITIQLSGHVKYHEIQLC